MSVPLKAGRVEVRRAFEIEVAGRLAIRTWSQERSGAVAGESVVVTDIWTQYETSEWQPRARPARLFGQLLTDHNLQPHSFRQMDGNGRLVFDLTVDVDKVTASYADGTVLAEEIPAPEFLLPANAVTVLAAKVERLIEDGGLPYEGNFLSPESLEVIPYRIDREEPGLRTSLDELLEVENGRLVGLERRAAAVQARVMQRRRPSWPARGSRSRGTTTNGAANYNPPRGVSVTSGTVPSAGGTQVGFALATPGEGEALAVALFSGGSGGHDRHGFVGGLDLGYHQLLDGLCRFGLASVRFDKRGHGTTPLGSDILDYGFADIVADARACFEVAAAIAREQGVPLVLVGHSEGALVTLRLAAEEPRAAGVVLLAAPARPLPELMVEQTRARAAELSLPPDAIERRIDEFNEFIECVRRLPPEQWRPGLVPDAILTMRRLAHYYQGVLDIDTCALVRDLDQPLLILHGAQDQQVPLADATKLERCAVQGGVTVTAGLIQGANHLFKSTADVPSIADYYDRRRRVVPEAVDEIGNWIRDLAQHG